MYDVRVHNWRYEDVEEGLSYPSMVLMFVHMSSCMMMVRVVGGMSGAICVRGCLLAYTWVASFLPIRSYAPRFSSGCVFPSASPTPVLPEPGFVVCRIASCTDE